MRLFRSRWNCNRKWHDKHTCRNRVHHKCVRAPGHDGEHCCRCGLMRP